MAQVSVATGFRLDGAPGFQRVRRGGVSNIDEGHTPRSRPASRSTGSTTWPAHRKSIDAAKAHWGWEGAQEKGSGMAATPFPRRRPQAHAWRRIRCRRNSFQAGTGRRRGTHGSRRRRQLSGAAGDRAGAPQGQTTDAARRDDFRLSGARGRRRPRRHHNSYARRCTMRAPQGRPRSRGDRQVLGIHDSFIADGGRAASRRCGGARFASSKSKSDRRRAADAARPAACTRPAIRFGKWRVSRATMRR